jgi:hypothetical protein
MTGYAETLDQGFLDKDIWLFGLDKDGHNIASWPEPRIIQGYKDDIGNYLQLLSDGRIVITGLTRSDQLEKLYSHAFVLITNSIGKGGNIFTIPSTSDESGNCIRVLDDNNFIVTGTSRNPNTSNGLDIMLKKVTLTGGFHTIWEQKFGGLGDDYGQHVIVGSRSLYLLVTMAAAGNNSSVALITTDQEGNNEEISTYGAGSQLSSSSFGSTSDNGFIIAGTNKHSENNISLALIKIKSANPF